MLTTPTMPTTPKKWSVEPCQIFSWIRHWRADSSDKGAKTWFSVYYKCQKSPKKIAFHLPTGGYSLLNLPWRYPRTKAATYKWIGPFRGYFRNAWVLVIYWRSEFNHRKMFGKLNALRQLLACYKFGEIGALVLCALRLPKALKRILCQ